MIVKDNPEEEKQDITLAPHLALTHMEYNHGSANKRNVSLLMKAGIDLTEKQKDLLLKMVGEENIEKMSYNGLNEKLSAAVRAKYKGYNDWVWLSDFDENVLVFSNDDGLYSVEYEVDENGKVSFTSAAIPVNRVISYEEASGNIVLSESADGVDSKVVELIEKSFDKIKDNSQLKNVLKTKLEKGKKDMEQEIQKAVDAAIAPVQKELAKAQESLEKAVQDKKALQEQLDEINKAAIEAKQAQRLEVLKGVISDEEQLTTLHKSLEVLEDEAFEAVVKSLTAKKEALENSDLFKQRSSGASQEEGGKESFLTQTLKAKYAKSE